MPPPRLNAVLIEEPRPAKRVEKPKSVKIDQGPLEFFQKYNDSLYESIMKAKRRNTVAKYTSPSLLRHRCLCLNHDHSKVQH